LIQNLRCRSRIYLLSVLKNSIQELLSLYEYKSHYNIPFVKYYGYHEEYFKNMLNDRMQLTKYTNKGASSEKHVLTQKKFIEMVEMRKKQ